MISKPQVIACNMAAISSAQRPRYDDLVKRLSGSIEGRREIADGYTFRLDTLTNVVSVGRSTLRVARNPPGIRKFRLFGALEAFGE